MSGHLEGLSLVEMLELMEPVPEPPAIPMTPQTVGWVWVGVGVAIALFLGIRALIRKRRANAYRRAALAELERSRDDPAVVADVLRRAALVAFPRDQVAGLSGPEWLSFLDRSMGGTGFAAGPGEVLAEAPYRDCDPTPETTELARRWIRKHDPSVMAVPT